MAAGGILAIFLLILSSTAASQEVKSSQIWSVLRLRQLLGNPPFLSVWANFTNPCTLDPSPSLTVVCYYEEVTQLQISGSSSPLPRSFSIDSFFTTLTRLPNLKVLSLTNLGLWGILPGHKLSRLSSLEILNLSSNSLSGPLPHELSSLSRLQSLVIDHNRFSGELLLDLGKLSFLAVLSAKNNSFSGKLPVSISRIDSLRVLDFSGNGFSGALPDLSGLSNLQRLDLGDNQFGPDFPELGRKISVLVLSKNSFTGGLPSSISSYQLLQKLDISHNRFVGPFPTSILSLPSINYLDISGNKFTGTLFSNLSCNDMLQFVNISFNLLTGVLPECLARDSSASNISYLMNCLSNGKQPQNPYVFCRNQALAVGVIPKTLNKNSTRKIAVVASSVVAAIGAAVFIVFLTFFTHKKLRTKRIRMKPPRRLVEHASNGYSSKLLSDARYISQTVKLGALGIPSYRPFSLEELEEATNRFQASAFFDEGSHGKIYWGTLNDDSMVAIRCLKLKRNQSFTKYIELFSKLRHQHLISALGHSFEHYLDDSSISRVFLVFEHVANGTLRSHLCEGFGGQKFTWSQRISAAIGVAKGIQFLHAGIIPGLFANGIKTTNVLLDHNLVAKICSYDLPVIAENMPIEMGSGSFSNVSRRSMGRNKHEDKKDVYDFGVILLELVTGEPITSTTDVNMLKNQFEGAINAGAVASNWRGVCNDESVGTVIELCARCLSADPLDRPSVEDILWNLQFAAQVQESWRDARSSSDSPVLARSPLFT